ncbi:MAG: YopX family protein [Tenuifilaceae bacterium]|jgi:uncharacterized phage protein (TIGR01671 family)|nr:YopX family protein [Tenuifilaceae bacterium]
MNREIKFRGIREKYNSAWHRSIFRFGNLLNNNSIGEVGYDLTHYEYAKVKPETIGQFTGLLDKNGNEIYEGDLVKHDAWDYPFEVIFNDEKASFVCKLKTGLTQYIDFERLVVVGNIHESVVS